MAIDAEVPLSAFTGDTFNLLQQLEPFGQGNPQPTFLTRQVQVVDLHNFGNQSQHLELKLKQRDITWKAVSFNSQKAPNAIPSYIDIVYKVEKSFWGSEEVLDLSLLDFAPSG